MNKKKANIPPYISTIHLIFTLMSSAVYGNDCFSKRQFSFWPEVWIPVCSNPFQTSEDRTALALAGLLQAVGYINYIMSPWLSLTKTLSDRFIYNAQTEWPSIWLNGPWIVANATWHFLMGELLNYISEHNNIIWFQSLSESDSPAD